MSDAPAPVVPAPAPRWMRNIRLAAAAMLLILAAPFVFLGTQGRLGIAILIIFGLPLLMPHLLVLWRLRRGPQEKGLRLAAGTGLAAFSLIGLIFLLIAWLAISEPGFGRDPWMWGLLAAYALLAWTQWAQFQSARRLQEFAPATSGAQRRWVFSAAALFVYYLALLFLVGGTLPSLLRPTRRAPNEGSAVGSLRTLNTVAMFYQEQYKNGYPPNLAVLKAPATGTKAGCRAADLIDGVLASGRKSGYVFDYRSGSAVEASVAGCPPGGKTYTISARPEQYKKTGTRSFFTDETGVIRWTVDDRAATTADPPIS